MRNSFLCLLSFLVLLASTPVYSCDEHDSDKDQLQSADDTDSDKKSNKHKKHKGKKHKNLDKDDNDSDSEDKPDSFIRGETPGKEPVLELD